ncbi:TolC family protein [Pedobacter sp. N36a]|uniref:TolC family protein n=1 Tax=Pedobacter sp. N36a TaxID=2767996 RepID=UPI001656A51F|nr:TolC family protein [Pedobacter sp. N36a]MBC8984157.1 TolC family protein [Pedobacter sp. N36a]
MERSKTSWYAAIVLLLFSISGKGQSTSGKDLDYFVHQGLTNSPVLNDYKNQQISNRIDSLRWRAGYRPQVTASSTGLYAPIVKGYGYDQTLSNGQSLEALLTVNYLLTGQGRIQQQQQQLKIHSDSIQYAANWSVLDLKKNITDQYLNAYASQEQMVFNAEVYELLKKEEVILKKLTRANTYKQSEYLTFLVTFQQQRLSWKQAEMQFNNDYAMLNYLCGIIDTVVNPIKVPDISAATPVGGAFFTTRYKLDSLKNANDKVGVALNYKPKASIYVNGGYNSSFLLQPYKNFGTSVGFTLSIPIYDGHQKAMQLQQLNIQLQTGLAYKAFFVRQHQQQIHLLLLQIRENQDLYPQLNEQIRFAKSLIEVDSRLLHTGELRIADYIIAINNYLAAKNLLRQIQVNGFKLINQFNYWNR